MLEDATGGLSFCETLKTQTVLINGDRLAGLRFTPGTRGNIKCRGFGCDNPAMLQTTEHEGDPAGRVQRRGVLIHEGPESTKKGR